MNVNRKLLICNIALCVATLLATTAMGQDDDQMALEGIYSGTMNLADGSQRSIPLTFSLTLTGETFFTPDGEERQVIDGSFLVDEEGGPYPFFKVSLDLAQNRIDLRYDRPPVNPSDEVPTSFRLIGKFKEDGSIEGRVLSGNRGPIGTFSTSHTSLTVIQVRTKYHGKWVGHALLVPENETIPFEIGLENSLVPFTNPPDMEFEYTRGKIGYFKWRSQKFHFTHISIDYLRRRIIMSQQTSSGGGPAVTLECQIDFEKGLLIGNMNSVMNGHRAKIELIKVD